MKRSKICLLGSFAVGKTSLVQRYVKGIFSDKYLTTLGVKIDKKKLCLDGHEIEFIIWDLAGEDEFMSVRKNYLRGTAAYFLVVDGTRNETLETALSLHQMIQENDPSLPFVLLINKLDIKTQWNLDEEKLQQLKKLGWQIMETSAKDNTGVSESFQILASALLGK